MATPTPTPDAFDVRDELLRLTTADPAGFCSLLYEVGLDLQGAVYRHRPSPYAKAAREAGFAMGEVALRYARIADEVAEAAAVALADGVPAETAGSAPAARLLAA